MKSLKWKLLSCSLTLFLAVGILGSAFANQPNSYSKKLSSSSLRDEKLAINNDLSRINLQQERVNDLKQQCKEDKKAGVESGTTYTALMKARADLQREKAYLKADKKALVMAHQELIDARQDAIREQRAQLREEQRKLDADLAEGKASAVMHAQAVVEAKHDLKLSEEALDRQLDSREADMMVINRELRDYKGESAFALTVEERNGRALAKK